ncbi:hypothetical protein [Shinella zoogloeoides]|uniref:hypothetical protein n=1 Tax=Shinella zoogloeoides TaxID=352475 RepID=UPI00273D15EC|nr:hypothetical protein [Shinella zoogloeoides]WLR92149.1 hypothetical protein Q9316_17030 [Shinella zoogloeoides]
MGDQSKSLFERPLLAKLGIFQDANDEAQDALRAEKVAAEKQAIIAEAYRQMPADLRQRAAEWGVSALMETIWLNGWDCGYRQSMRDARAAKGR